MTSPWNDPPTPPGGGQGGQGGYPAGPPQHGGPGGYPAGPPPHGGPSFLGGPGSSGPGSYPAYPTGPASGGPPAAPPRPGPLGNAVVLMYVGAAIALLNLLSTFLFTDDIREATEESLRDSDQAVTDSAIDAAVTLGIVVGVVFGLIGVGLWIWMAVKNNEGKGWARVTATVLGGLGIVTNLFGLLGASVGGGGTPIAAVVSVVNLVLAVAILVLLWNSQNAAYYRANS